MRAIVVALLALTPTAARGLCVTEGAIAPAPGGASQVEGARLRAVEPASDGLSASLRFRDLGPSTESRPLASGEMRHQIGLKLRAQDACNLAYVMWRLAPEPQIVVSLKLNPGQSHSAECGNRGYTNVAQAPAPAGSGTWRTLRAETRGTELTVTADGRPVWRGTLPAAALRLEGPAGLRADNTRAEFVFTPARGARRGACPAEGGE